MMRTCTGGYTHDLCPAIGADVKVLWNGKDRGAKPHRERVSVVERINRHRGYDYIYQRNKRGGVIHHTIDVLGVEGACFDSRVSREDIEHQLDVWIDKREAGA